MGAVQIKIGWQHCACQVITYTVNEVAPQSSLNKKNVSRSVMMPATSYTLLFPPQIVSVHLHRDRNDSVKKLCLLWRQKKNVRHLGHSMFMLVQHSDTVFYVSTNTEFWTRCLSNETISSQMKNICISLTTSKKNPVICHPANYQKRNRVKWCWLMLKNLPFLSWT